VGRTHRSYHAEQLARPLAVQSVDVPICSSACDVSELPPSRTQNAAEVLPFVHVAAGCVQLPLTAPLTA
jgi:hypothetical protein